MIAAVIGLVPKFSTSNLFDITPDGSTLSSDFLPMGISGLVAALVYGIWFFLAVEGVPLAAEETEDPKRDMPRGIITAMVVLLVFAACMLSSSPGGRVGDRAHLGQPAAGAIRAVYGDGSLLADFVNYAGLAGLVASFFSIIYAYSRQLFALSRAGYLPRVLSLTSGRNTPWVALIVPGHDRVRAGRDHQGRRAADQHRRLRSDDLLRAAQPQPPRAAPTRARPRARLPHPRRRGDHRTRSGAQRGRVVATFFVDIKAAGITAAVFVAALAYFWFYSRHHLVASAPEEEFDQLDEAENELK